MTAISRAIQIVIFAIIAIFLFLIFNLSVGFSFVLGLCISYLGSLLSYAHFLILQKLRFNAFFLVLIASAHFGFDVGNENVNS